MSDIPENGLMPEIRRSIRLYKKRAQKWLGAPTALEATLRVVGLETYPNARLFISLDADNKWQMTPAAFRKLLHGRLVEFSTGEDGLPIPWFLGIEVSAVRSSLGRGY